MKKYIQWVPWILFLIALVALTVREFQRNKVFESAITTDDSAKVHHNHGIDESFNSSIVLETKRQLEIMTANNDTLRKMIAQFKRVTSTTVINTITTIKDSIPFAVAIPCDFETVSFSKLDSNYSIYGSVDKNQLKIDSLQIPNEQTIVLGEKKKHLFKPSEFELHVVNSNSLIKTNKIQSLVIKSPKKWYERPIVQFTVGMIAGYTLNNIH